MKNNWIFSYLFFLSSQILIDDQYFMTKIKQWKEAKYLVINEVKFTSWPSVTIVTLNKTLLSGVPVG